MATPDFLGAVSFVGCTGEDASSSMATLVILGLLLLIAVTAVFFLGVAGRDVASRRASSGDHGHSTVITMDEGARVGGHVAGRDVVINEAQVDELIGLLEHRTSKALRELEVLSTLDEVSDVRARYIELHTRHMRELRARHFVAAHEVGKEIAELQAELQQIVQRGGSSAAVPSLSLDPEDSAGALTASQVAVLEETIDLIDVGVGESASEAARRREWERSVLTVLADVFNDSEPAKQFLEAIDFPGDRMPVFTTPDVFWGQVAREVRRGLLPGGLVRILEQVMSNYPHDSKLAPLWNARPPERSAEEHYAALLARVRHPKRA